MNSRAGFTLIELLTVVAIISLLASVVLAALSQSRSDARNASIRQSLASIRTAAEQFQNAAGAYSRTTGLYYSGNCLTTATMFRETTYVGEERDIAEEIEAAIEAAYVAGGSSGKQCRLNAARTQYMVAISFHNSTDYWCVDSNSAAKRISALPPVNVVACP